MYQDNGGELVEIFRRAKATGVTTCLDMSLPDPGSAAGRADWPAILRATLPYVDIFLPSIEETLYALRRPTYDRLHEAAVEHNITPLVTPELLSDVSDELLALGVKAVGIKLGDRGLYLRTAGEAAWRDAGRGRPSDLAAWAGKELWAPCFQVDVVGATGSGDATIAGFLAALLRGLSAAGCKDILALALPDKRSHPIILQHLLKRKHPLKCRSFQPASLMRIIGNEIQLAGYAFELFSPVSAHLHGIINPVDKHIFKGDHAAVAEADTSCRRQEAS